jgi:hypothetical protein
MAERTGWANRVRDGLLLVLGTSMILTETVGTLLGRPADYLIVGAGLVILGVIPKLPDGRA